MEDERRKVRQGHGVLTALLNTLPIPHFAFLGKPQVSDRQEAIWSILSSLGMRLQQPG